MPALLTVIFFIKTTTTVYQLKSNEVTVTSIYLAHELITLLIVVNNVDVNLLMRSSRCVGRDSEQISKSNNLRV